MASDPVDTSGADYDAGLLNDYGGGNVEWWWDYLRAEIGRANDHWRQQHEALAKERDASIAARTSEREALNHAITLREEYIADLAAQCDAARADALAAASREQEARAEAGRLRELLGAVIGERLSGESNPNVPNHKTVTVAIAWGDLRAARAALAQEPRHD